MIIRLKVCPVCYGIGKNARDMMLHDVAAGVIVSDCRRCRGTGLIRKPLHWIRILPAATIALAAAVTVVVGWALLVILIGAFR